MKIITNFIIYLIFGLVFSLDNQYCFNDISNVNSSYFFDLSIPKINLDYKVKYFSDKNNDVDKGVYLVKDYDFNTLRGSLILASHSGNSSISYFKYLDKVSTNDIVKITYKGSIYYYKINEIYKINKTGRFNYNNDDKLIYLITCDKKSNTKQLVFKGELIKINKKSTFF